MSQHIEKEMNLSELEQLMAQSTPELKQLFVKTINIYTDPMRNAEDDDQKRDALKAAIEATIKKS
jgi:hypothetical protein